MSKVKFAVDPEILKKSFDETVEATPDRTPDDYYTTAGKVKYLGDDYFISYWYPENVMFIEAGRAGWKAIGKVASKERYQAICELFAPSARKLGLVWDSMAQSFIQPEGSAVREYGFLKRSHK
jgi:hypothetical protein